MYFFGKDCQQYEHISNTYVQLQKWNEYENVIDKCFIHFLVEIKFNWNKMKIIHNFQTLCFSLFANIYIWSGLFA